MKILYDHQIFSFQKYGGISRYFTELINNHDEYNAENTTIFSNNNYLYSNTKRNILITLISIINFRGRSRIFYFFNKIYTILKIKKGDFDVFHPTYYDPYFLKYLGSRPFVLTVHDMIPEKLPKEFDENDDTSKTKKMLVEKACKIIAVSEYTKKDLIELFDVSSCKIEVIYHGFTVASNNYKLVLDLPVNYILFVGSRRGYKNFNRFINGISKFLIENESFSIVCVGGGKIRKEEHLLFKKLNIQNLVFQFNVDDKFLSQFYSRAKAFVFPSLYEGFGIPVLEAFACQCPVVCSNTSSLPEIAGEGAVYFDPYCEQSIYEEVVKVLFDKELRKKKIKKGTDRLKNFSWNSTVDKTKDVYLEAIKSSNEQK